MSNTIFKFLAALLLPAMLSAADDLLVADGAATADAVILRNSFRPEGGCLTGEGTGGLVSSLYLYRADDFQVTANLTLRELNRTAAGLRVNDKLWSLDNGGDGKLFFEDIGSSHGTPLLPAEQFIVPGKPFILKLTGKGGVMTFEIDGKTVGTANYDVNIPVEIALRPWRNRMEIRSLAITGRQAGLAAESKPTPVADTPVDILTGGTLPIMPGFNLPTGTWQAELRPVAAPQNGYRFELPLDSPDRLTLSPEACMAAYRRSGADALLAQPFELVMTAPEQNRRYSCRLVLFDSRKPADFPRASVSGKDGSCYFAFNGKECGTITSRLAIDNRALELSARSLRQFAAAGIPGQIVMVEPWKFVKNGVFDRQAFMKNLESSLCRLIVEAPDARFHLQLFLYMPPEWGAANPAECIKLDNGVQRLLNAPDQKLQPSYASPAWRSEMGNILRETVAGLRHSPFADRIAYLRLLYANCGEWNHWGYHENAFVDFSEPMRRAFAEYLKQKYRTDAQLQQAWGRPAVTFDSPSLLPDRECRLSAEPNCPLRFGGAANRPAIDYYDFFQAYTVDTISYFAGIAKAASDNRLLVGAYYGYFFGHYGANPYHFQDSGIYATGKMLREPNIDFFGGPYPYSNRTAHLELNSISDSIRLHGKVWESEGDQRTHYPGAFAEAVYGRTASLAESIAVAKRDFMVNLQRGASYYFYDFGRDWYRDEEFMNTIASLRKIDAALRKLKRKDQAEVAVIFSEETVPYLTSRPEASLTLFAAQQRSTLSAWGLPVHHYLSSDLGNIDFSQYKAVIFANLFYADDNMIRTIRSRVAGGNRTLIFFYAPGVVGPANEFDPERSCRLTGIGIRRNGEPGDISSISTPWSPAYKHAPFHWKLTTDDPQAQTFGTLSDGTPAGAQKLYKNWKSIVIYHPLPDAVFMRGLLGRNQVQVRASGKSGLDDVYFAGPLIGVYSRIGGDKTVQLPRKAEIVVDLFSGRELGRNTASADFSMPKGTPDCRIIFAGSLADYRSFQEAAKEPAPGADSRP